METHKAAVVGLGIGMGHVAGYLTSRHSELVAVADAWSERRATVGGTFAQGSMQNLRGLFDQEILARRWEDIGVRVYEDVNEVAADAEVTLVSLCTPDDTHEQYAISLLEAGKHLILEKPMALTIPAAKRIADAAERSGRRLAINYEMRINPAVRKLRELVTSGALGEVQAFNLQQYRKPFRRDKWQQWIQQRERSGGMIVEETCHWFDLARYLTGREAATIHCVANDRILPDFDYEDIAFVQGTFNDGSIFQIGHSLTGFDFSIIIQIHGTAGSAWCGLKAEPHSFLDARQTDYIGVVSWGPVDAGPTERGPAEPQYVTFGDEALEAQNIRDHVVACVEALAGGNRFLADDEDGLRSLEVAFAARRSIESGREEKV